MENWIDAKLIDITGYSPRLLGDSDDAAVLGYLHRMEELISYSKERGLKLKPLIEGGDRKSAEPLILECALETSRVVGDLLHTLGALGGRAIKDGASLRGTIVSKAPPALEAIPAKIMIEGTLFSTLADPSGVYEFRNLPPGPVRLLVVRAGSRTARIEIPLEKDGRHLRDMVLDGSTPPGNLLRNGDFQVFWVSAKGPDGWIPSKDAWESEPVPVSAGGKLRLQARWKKDARGDLFLRWRASSVPYGPSQDEAVLRQGEESSVVSVPEKMTHVRVFIRGGAPYMLCDSIALTLEP
jgi:hypothetical protein